MKSKSNIQMTFVCDQDWDTMKATSCGKFCDVCKKEVIDFTKKPLSEFNHLNEKELCGRFLAEQVDLSLLKPIQFPFSKRAALYFATLVFAFSSKDSIAKTEKQKIEIIDPAYKSVIKEKTVIENRATQNISTVKDPDKPFLTTKKRKYYWSKKFPFIRSAKRYTMGMRVKFL